MRSEWDPRLNELFETRVDGASVNPQEVGIDLVAAGQGSHRIEMDLEKTILLFELEQVDIQVTRQSLRSWVEQDISKSKKALAAYLKLSQANPMRYPGKLGFLKRRQPSVKWFWMTVEGVDEKADVVSIVGTCRAASERPGL